MEWDHETKSAVWAKGVKISEDDPNIFRKDKCGARIERSSYHDRTSSTNFGWEVDHIDPNGGDDLSNLQPLHWKNNLDKSDGQIKCNVTSSGIKNIES